MSNWYQVKIRYQVQDEKGRNKTTNEVYVVDAVSYTDAEARIYTHVAPNIPDFHITGLSRMKMNEIFFIEEGAEIWYKVKVLFVSFDEKAQKESKIAHTMLVNAKNPLEAYNLVSERLGTVEDFEITDLNITNILEIIPYEEPVDERLKHGNFVPLKDLVE
jgi:Domain of unknown function (DUF4494)